MNTLILILILGILSLDFYIKNSKLIKKKFTKVENKIKKKQAVFMISKNTVGKNVADDLEKQIKKGF